MSYTRGRRQEDYEYRNDLDQQQDEQRQATNRSIDETKNNIHRTIDEVRRETPRYAQVITDFQNETADATREITDNFLESQKEVINSMQSAWDSLSQSTGVGGGRAGGGNNYWTGGMIGRGGGTMMPFFFSPEQMANIYARTIGAMAEAYATSARMATNALFAGLEATRATTNYTRQNAKEASRITSNTARAFGQTARETVQVQGEDQQHIEGGVGFGGGSSSSGAGGRAGGGTTTSGSGTDTTTTTTKNTVNLSDTVSGVTEKDRKKS
jgi:hypothetical protein